MTNFKYSIPVTDGDGQVGRISGYVVAADIAAATTRVQTVANTADNLNLGRIGDTAKITAEILLDRTTLKATAGATADREVKGEFTFVSSTGHKTVVTIPTFDKDSWTVSGGDIDLTDVTVQAFVDEIVDNAHADNRYADITSLVKAVEAFK